MLHLPGAAGETGRWCALGGLGEASGSHLGQPPPEGGGRPFTFIAPRRLSDEPLTRARVRLLGPCFKTGRRDDRLLHRRMSRGLTSCKNPPRHSRMRLQPQQKPTTGSTEYRALLLAQHIAFLKLWFLARRETSKQRSSQSIARASAHTTCKCTSKTAQSLASQPETGLTNQRWTATRLNTGQIRRLYPFPSYRFHVLFNSLFKVLCNFPSQYLFAIGLVALFSLR